MYVLGGGAGKLQSPKHFFVQSLNFSGIRQQLKIKK